MASPSLALLSVFIAAKTRPTRLLVQEGSPAFVGNVGGLLGAVPVPTTFHDSEDLRISLRGLASSADRAWGIATHRPGALVPLDWFEAFEAGRVPTVELCLGGLFQLARRGRSASAVTIVSLDDEPAFEGAHLTGLLTNNSVLAQRVRQLCLGVAGSAEVILDAAPRGLAEDEPALLTLLERVITREEAALAEAKRTSSPPAAKGISLSWKRIFHAEPAESTPRAPEKPDPLPAPPRGQNPWLTRLESAEQEHGQALHLANAALEASRAQNLEEAQRAKAVADEWKGRFETADSRAAALSEELAFALAETRRLIAAHEEGVARDKEREAQLRSEGEAARRVLSDRVAAVELSASRTESRAAALENEKARLLEAVRLARDQQETLAEELKQAEETAGIDRARLLQSHAEALATRDVRIRTLETDRDQVESLRKAAVADRDRHAKARSAAMEAAERARLELVSGAQKLEAALAEALARLESREAENASLLAEKVAVSADRDAAVVLRQQAEEAHREALRLAGELAQTSQRENAELAGQFKASLSAAAAESQARLDAIAAQLSVVEAEKANLSLDRDVLTARLREAEQGRRGEQKRFEKEAASWQTRLESTTKSATKKAQQMETRHAAQMARLEDEIQQLRGQGQVEARVRQNEASLHQERVMELQQERAAALARFQEVQARAAGQEQEHLEALRLSEQRVSAVQIEKAQEAARLNAAIAELELRLEGARRADQQYAALQLEKNEEAARLVAAAASGDKQAKTLTERLSELQRANTAHKKASAEQGERLAVIERKRIAALAECHALEARLREQEGRQVAALGSAEERASVALREKAEETSRLKAMVAEGQSRFDAAAKEAANEARRIEAGHAALINRIQAEADQLRREGRALVESGKEEARDFARRLSAFEKDKAKALEARAALQRRLREMEADHRDALRLMEDGKANERREHVEKLAKSSAAQVEAQSRLDAEAKASTRETQRLEDQRAVEVHRPQAELTRMKESAARLTAAASAAESDVNLEVEEAPVTVQAPEDQSARGIPLMRIARLPPKSPSWEYERIVRGGARKQTTIQILLKKAARRIRGTDA